MNVSGLSTNWDKEIKELGAFFENTVIPTEPIKLDKLTTVSNANKFIAAHLQMVKLHNGEKIFQSYLNRLVQFKNTIK